MFDVFLSYDSRDRPAVEAIAGALRERGLDVFLDRWFLTPGRPWQEELENALNDCHAVAVILGPHGMGPWQKREYWVALDRQARNDRFLVVPILIPDADPPLGFLSVNTWIDLRAGADGGEIDRLADALYGRTQAAAPAVATGAVCPFRGLRPFREEDAEFFFGREDFTNALAQSVDRQSLIAVIGASGCGKSSVVRAGLLPQLRGSGERVWEILVMFPGDDPLRAFAAAALPLLEPEPSTSETERLAEIARLTAHLADGTITIADVARRILERQPGTDRLLIVVDQWEELYTLCPDASTRHRFIDGILGGTRAEAFSAVFTLRADFYGHLVAYRPLADRLEQAARNLGPMTRTELERAVEQPAARAGLLFEAGLADKLVDAVEREPANLPLLEFVLAQLWEQRRGNQLTHAAYEAMGEVEGAIAERADAVWEQLDDDGRRLLRAVFLRLVRTAENSPDTRRRALLRELDPRARPVMDRLAAARLIVLGRDDAGEETVEIGHESLIRHWQRLDEWIREDREFLAWLDRLHRSMSNWSDDPQDSALLKASALETASRWLAARPLELSAQERAWIARSVRTAKREIRKRRLATAGLILLVAGVPALAFQGYRVWKDGVVNETVRIARVASQAADPLIGALLLAEIADRTEPPGGAVTARRLADSRIPRARMLGHTDRVAAAAWSPDGERVATAGSDSIAFVWSADGRGDPVVLRGHTGSIERIAFSPDGESILTASTDGTARIWKRDGRPATPPLLHDDELSAAAFDPAGDVVLTASWDGTAKLHARADGRVVRTFDDGAGSPIFAAAFSPDGNRIVTGSRTGAVRVWTVANGAGSTIGSHADAVFVIRFSPNGTRMLTGSRDGSAQLRAMPGGQLLATYAFAGAIRDAAFSPDNSRLAVAADDSIVRVWTLASAAAPIELHHMRGVQNVDFDRSGEYLVSGVESAGLTREDTADAGTARLWALARPDTGIALVAGSGSVLVARFDPSGQRIITGTSTGKVRVWNTHGGGDPLVLQTASAIRSMAIQPGDRMIAATADDGVVRLWSLQDPAAPVRLEGHHGPVTAVAFAADGDRLITTSRDSTAIVWTVARETVAVLRGHAGAVTTAALNAAGTIAFTGGNDGVLRLWDLGVNTPVSTVHGRHDAQITSIALAPDGSSILTASGDSTARLWERDATARATVLRGHTGWIFQAAFDARGARVVTASADGIARVWPVRGGDTLTLAHGGAVLSAAFDPRGHRVVTASRDGTLRVWSIERLRAFIPLRGHRLGVIAASFSPDGRRVLSASDDSTARVWNADGTGEEMVLRGHAGALTAAAFLADGARIVTASADGTLRVWRSSWAGLLRHLARTTTACLTVDERTRILRESSATAAQAHHACELRHQRHAVVEPPDKAKDRTDLP